MRRGKRAVVVGEARGARSHGDGVMVDLTGAGTSQVEDGRAVVGVFTPADVAEILSGLPLERFDATDQLSIDETITALRKDR